MFTFIPRKVENSIIFKVNTLLTDSVEPIFEELVLDDGRELMLDYDGVCLFSNIDYLQKNPRGVSTLDFNITYGGFNFAENNQIFQAWNWSAFSVLFIWCITQNIFVELFLYHDQLSEGKSLSWAPLAPTGQFFNPLLFEFNERSVMLQTQLPWLIISPILYIAAIAMARKY